MNTNTNTNTKCLKGTDVELLKSFEVVSNNVSNKYVPIFSSQIVAAMAPEFEFLEFQKYFGKRTPHSVTLQNTVTGEVIKIFNSYDGTMALRMFYVEGNLPIDLGVERLIHRGEKAKDFKESIEDAKFAIIDAVETAKTLNQALENTKVTKKQQKRITEVVFSRVLKRKGVNEVTNYVDVLVETAGERGNEFSIKKYILGSIKEFIDGNYTYVQNGVKKNGRKINSAFGKLEIENEVVQMIEDEFVEVLL